MSLLALAVLSLLCLGGYAAAAQSCPCSDPSLCNPISGTPDKEILAFVTSQDNWPHYNWSLLTTVALFTDFNDSLLCYAHSKGVRVVLSASYPVTDLQNSTRVKVSATIASATAISGSKGEELYALYVSIPSRRRVGMLV